MPSKKSIFTPLSILFRPHQKPVRRNDRFLVEAPGTAPGSNGFITPPVYCHSCRGSTSHIGTLASQEKGFVTAVRQVFAARLFSWFTVRRDVDGSLDGAC